jgi:aspartate oxidase
VRNLAEVGSALVEAATAREESRGAHTRADHPETSAAFRCRLVAHG